jgi:hypothetical protein
MMNLIKFSLTGLFLFLTILLFGQEGYIRGTVLDDGTGEALPGVTIFLEGTTIGTLTDLDGKFNLPAPSGTYDLRVSFISYETIIIKGLQVKAGEVALYDNLRLKESAVELTEVVITAQEVRNTENALLTIKRKSANVIDGISSVSFRKIGDSDAAASMKRVSGVSVEGGKYVFVRGLGDRYTKTILNGMEIPGLDPDRNTIQMDIFPTNVIDNIIVFKSFTADLPADFTGGIIDIELKDFPEERKGSVSFSAGYNPSFHFYSDYLDYEGGKTDWLGMDDGTRAIPATENIPFFSEVVGDPDGPKGQRYREILESFNPTMAATRKTSFMDYSMGFSLGNQFPLKKVTLGYNFAVSYKYNTEYYKDAEFGRYGLSADPDNYEMEVREFQKGDYGVESVLWSGLAGFSIKTLNSKIGITILHLQNGESKAGIFDYQSSDQGTIFSGFQHNLEYGQRALTNLLISGKHNLAGAKWTIDWKVSPTVSSMEDPDIRFTRYVGPEDNYVIGTESGFPERIWRDLQESNLSGLLRVTREFDFLGQKSKLQVGGAYTYKERDFVIRNFALNIRNVPLTGNPDELFFEENLWPLDGNVSKGTTYEAPFIPVNPNQFNANSQNAAGYVSLEISPFTRLKTILGVRVENFVQRYTGQDQLGINVLDNEKILDNTDFFPSVNLIYSISDKQNLRASYARTIARPSFKELSYAEIYDPVSGRTFIGGLFRDANDVAGVEYWDGNLVSADIDNFDLRWELFLEEGQTLSLSGFYKRFHQPIEIVQYATQTGSFQPRNVGDGEVLGAELEFRFNLGMIAQAIRNLSLTSNFTYTFSRIELSKTEYDSRVENARTGQDIGRYRDMAGQAPFIVNLGLAYNGGEKGFWDGFEAGLYYNVQGRTLQYVGIVDRPDIYADPFHSLNLNANKSLGKDKRIQVGIKVDNLLNEVRESVFVSYEAADQYFSRLEQGISFQLRLNYRIF